MATDSREFEVRKHRKSDGPNYEGMNGEEEDEPDFSDPDGYVDEISDEGHRINTHFQ